MFIFIVADVKGNVICELPCAGLAEINHNALTDNAGTEKDGIPGCCDKVDAQPEEAVETIDVSTNDPEIIHKSLSGDTVCETAESSVKPQVKQEITPEEKPVSFSWGPVSYLTVRMQVSVKNNGENETVGLFLYMPRWESQSPYQTMTIGEASHEIFEINDRAVIFSLDDLAPGDMVTVWLDWHIEVRPFTVVSSNAQLDLAKQLFSKSSGNCKESALSYISCCRDAGLTARYVVGFVSAGKGSLSGCRHAWVEIYIQDLGWILVDPNYGYFAELPAHDMRFIEGYDDVSLRLNYLGGELSVEWVNLLL